MNLFARVLEAYAARRCFICERMGPCADREFDVEAAYLECVSRPKPKPVLMETTPRHRESQFVNYNRGKAQ